MTPLVELVSRCLLLPIFMIAAALFVGAYGRPGDGFSAGVVAALGVLVQYLVFGHRDTARNLRLLPIGPTAAIGGLAIMVGVALLRVAWGEPLLSHAPMPGTPVAEFGHLKLHTATLFDAGIGCLVFGVLVSTFEMVAEIGDPTP
ncbi:MAG: MnhB domain-containing protein [Vicinamibacterales bacterium]